MPKLPRPRLVTLAALAATVGALLSIAATASASSTATVAPRDNCGGFNGHVVWTASSIQVYGEVWDNSNCSGSTSVWLNWDSPSNHNVNSGSADEGKTAGVNYEASTQQTPTKMVVTVCSTSGGWHCGAGATVGTTTSTTTTTTATKSVTVTQTTTTVVTVPVAVTVPQPQPSSRTLHAKLKLYWTWNGASTWLRRTTLGSIPAATVLQASCRGGGCPRAATARATGRAAILRLLRKMENKRYRAGDRLQLSFSATGWKPERAQLTIRRGRLPKIRLLGS